MKYKDFYKLLELETSRVTLEDIKSAYRNVAKKYHPDVNVGDALAEERIKDINEAYRILSNPSQKRKYDRVWNSRNNVKNYQKMHGKNIFDMFLGEIDTSNDNEVKNKKVEVKGENIETEINVSIKEAFYGEEKKILLKKVNAKSREISFKIPAGIRNGEKIRLIGQGKKGKFGGKNGDLLIKINIDDSKKFKLEGYDLISDLKLSPWEAALGAKIDIKTIDGEANVYIHHGIQSGEKITIPEKGYKNGKDGRGNLILNIKIVVPKELELNEKEMFEKLRDMSLFDPRKE